MTGFAGWEFCRSNSSFLSMAKGHSFVQWSLSFPWKKQNGILSSTAVVSSAFVVSFFAMVTIIAIGSFFVAVPLAFALVMVSLLSGGVLLRTRCSLFFSALVRQHAMVLNGTSHRFKTSARSSPRAFSSSPGRICNILALSRTTLSLSSACAEICILRMVLD